MKPASERQTSPPLPLREPFWARTKRLAFAVLFGIILLIPRLRRLRRRVWAWAVVRGVAALLGAALVWRFARGHAGATWLIVGVVLISFAALVKARPQTKSIDDTRRELGALVALNGGSFLGSDGAKPIRNITIFVHSEKLTVLTSVHTPVIEIPIAQLRQVEVRRASGMTSGNKKETWDLAITGDADATRQALFRYEGTFAEHLARIAQDTITSVWKKSLPVPR